MSGPDFPSHPGDPSGLGSPSAPAVPRAESVLGRRRLRSALGVAAVLAAVAASAGFALTARADVSASRLASTARADGSAPGHPTRWTTLWRDDFSGAAGTRVDPGKWQYDTGTGYPGGAATWGTGEVETMTDHTRNVYRDGRGHLVIRPVRDAAGNWTSGRIETRRTDFAAPPGGKLRVEASIQQPDVSGPAAAGYWPAFWMLGAAARPAGATNWPGIGEIDIMEDVNGLSSVFATLHCGVDPDGPCHETTGLGSGQHACAGCQTGFHTYAVEYDRSVTPEQIRWYVDRTAVFAVNASQVDPETWAAATHHGFFLILDVAMGGGFPAAFGAPTPTASTRSGVPMRVDYVAVYRAGPAPGCTP